MTKSKGKMLYARSHVDPVLKAVLSAIHKTAETPPKGYLTRHQWMTRWGFKCQAHTGDYLKKAVAMKLLQKRRYRVMTKGRLTSLDHYGPPLSLKD